LKEQLSKQEFREADYLDQLKSERLQNEKLLALLRQAEHEIERSSVQINMSKSLRVLQERENESNAKVEPAEPVLSKFRQEHEKEKIQGMEEKDKFKRLFADKMVELEARDADLRDTCSINEKLKVQLERISHELRSKAAQVDKMKPMVESLERKASVLREYVGKLTTKCEEWKESNDRQSTVIEKMQQKNLRLREKSSQIVVRYKKLSEGIKRRNQTKNEDSANWRQGRTKLNDVPGQLERELEQIAKELSLSPQGK
jgi:chromosome segregation ATPase